MAKWTGQTRGNTLGYGIIINAIKFFGLGMGYFMLWFVSFYFYFFVPTNRRILKDFYLNYVKIPKWKIPIVIYKNHILLGQSIIDKMALLIGVGDKIGYTNQGEHHLRELTQKKQGAFLISGHVGNWDVAGNLLKGFDANVSVVMYQNEHEKIQKLLEKQGSIPKFKVIAIGEDLSHLIKIYTAIKAGDLVCMHADRYMEDMKTEEFEFFGEQAKFPIGPFQLIQKLKAPYSFVFAMKESRYSYFFSATKPIIPTKPAKEIARDFVLLLEEKVRSYPEQWYNYYNFHDK